MPAPMTIMPLPMIPNLPLAIQLLADFYIYNPKSSPDYLLLLAEACDEAAGDHRFHEHPALAARILAAELRRRAPAYA